MKFIDKNTYGYWDSPHTFCSHQLDDETYGLLCAEKVFDELFDEDTEDSSKFKCPFTLSNANNCNQFKYHQNDKNPDAKRFKSVN